MLSAKIDIGELKKIKSKNIENAIDNILREVADKVRDRIAAQTQTPVDTGALRRSHSVVSRGPYEKWIISPLKADGSNIPLWQLIVYGHRTLSTPGQRRWWFRFLRKVGGRYMRQTPGGPGYVRGRDYPMAALEWFLSSGQLERITARYLEKYL